MIVKHQKLNDVPKGAIIMEAVMSTHRMQAGECYYVVEHLCHKDRYTVWRLDGTLIAKDGYFKFRFKEAPKSTPKSTNSLHITN
jgi:hypothetical protein